MPSAKKPQKQKKDTLLTTITGYVETALKNKDDLVVTREIVDDKNIVLHVMTGRLITPCMLGTLINRVDLQKEEGGRRITMQIR